MSHYHAARGLRALQLQRHAVGHLHARLQSTAARQRVRADLVGLRRPECRGQQLGDTDRQHVRRACRERAAHDGSRATGRRLQHDRDGRDHDRLTVVSSAQFDRDGGGDPPACLPCPDPTNPVIITIVVPTAAGWCAPMTAGLAATFAAQVNWQPPAPSSPPIPVRYDWTVTGPPGSSVTATQQGGATATTASGWIVGGSATAVPLNLTAPGTYTVAVAAVFGATSGLPTDANGAITCALVGSAQFTLQPCQAIRQCPSVSGLSPSTPCVDTVAGTPADLTVVASVNDPAGTAQTFDWNFGDTGSAGNQLATSTQTASHSYAAPGTYSVTCTVSSSDPNCTTRQPFTQSVTIPPCPSDGNGNGNGNGRSPVLGCAALLWVSLILMLIGALLF